MIIVYLVFLFTLGMLLVGIRSYIRAKYNKPYGVKYGMVLSRKTHQLIGTETDIMIDPVSGTEWLGDTRYITKVEYDEN